MWPVMAPLLANPDLAPQPEHIAASAAHFREMAEIRAGSPLFRLQTAEEVQARLRFLNTGPDQVPGVIIMDLSDTTGENLDPNYDRVVVVFNANDEELVYAAAELAGRTLELHPVLAASADPIVAGSSWDAATGTFTVPGRTTAVFVQAEGTEPAATATPEPTPEPTTEPTAEPTATAEPTEPPTAAPATEEPTATSAPAATEETPVTTEAEEELEAIGEGAARATARPEVVALSIGVIVTVVGAIVGLIAWLRGRK
jgi:hypothetical protein